MGGGGGNGKGIAGPKRSCGEERKKRQGRGRRVRDERTDRVS